MTTGMYICPHVARQPVVILAPETVGDFCGSNNITYEIKFVIPVSVLTLQLRIHGLVSVFFTNICDKKCRHDCCDHCLSIKSK